MNKKKTAVVDFDNTIAGYDKWRGEHVIGPIIPYSKEALNELREWGWEIVVFTTRGNSDIVSKWLSKHGLGWCKVNSVEHNPPGTSNKPIGEVYFDDRCAYCVGECPYNWHRAMSRVRKRYQPKLDTYIDDAALWSSWYVRYFIAPSIRRQFRNDLSLNIDLIQLRVEGKNEIADAIEREAYSDPLGM